MSTSIWKNNRILITGGAGFLGRSLISRLYNDNEIVVYSRDEAKHYKLKQRYPNIRCIVGDIADIDSLRRAAKGCHRAVFAASMKQIEACDENPYEAIKTIAVGAINSRIVAEEEEMLSACFISSDKSRAPSTIYGALKFVGGESFILNPPVDRSFTTLVYGNVMNSTGSIIPVIWDKIKRGETLTLYDPDMTRFMITADSAVDVILQSPNYNGVTLVPKLSSFRVVDLLDIYRAEFNLEYKIGSPRVGEKIHEIMVCEEEVRRTTDLGSIFSIHPKELASKMLVFPNNDYNSRDFTVDREKLHGILKAVSFFRNE